MAVALSALGLVGAGMAHGAGSVYTAADMKALGHGKPVDAAFGADRMTLSVRRDGTHHLSFSHLSPRVELMGVAPAFDRASARLEHWAAAWKGLYGATEPNIVVTSGMGWNRTRRSYTLAKARYDAGTRTMDFTLRPMFTGARGRPYIAAPGTRRVKPSRRQLGPGTVFVQQATRGRNRGGVDATHSAGRMTLRTDSNGVTRLVLNGYAPNVELTGVAPAHDRLSVPTAAWARGWKRLYGRTKPNALLAYGPRGSAGTRVSVALSKPRFNPVKRTLDFVVRPVGDAPLPTVAPGTSRVLGTGVLFVDQTTSTDFGSQSAQQNQAAVNAFIQMGMLDAVEQNVYECCAVAATWPENVNNIQNGLPKGQAYDGLVTAPGFSGTMEFSYAPAFGSVAFTSNQTITFANGMDLDGAMFGLNGPGAFEAGGAVINFGDVAPGTPKGNGGTYGIVIYNGDYTNAVLQGTLGSESALIGGTMTGATIDAIEVNDAIIANISFEGATFASADSGTQFNDSALLGVSFEGATVLDALAFYGTDLLPLSVPTPSGESETVITSFAGIKDTSFLFAPSQTGAAGSATISEVSFANSSWDQFAISKAIIQGSDFSGADLGMPVFTSSTIDNSNNFDQANFGRVQFNSCAFNGTDLTQAEWITPVFSGTSDAPTVLEGVTFSADTFSNNSSNTLEATFEYTVFNGTTFVGLDQANSDHVSFISGIMNATGNRTEGLGLIAFNTQYVQGQNGDGEPAWYQVNSTGTEWTPIDTTTLEPTGPATNVDPVPAPEPEPEP